MELNIEGECTLIAEMWLEARLSGARLICYLGEFVELINEIF